MHSPGGRLPAGRSAVKRALEREGLAVKAGQGCLRTTASASFQQSFVVVHRRVHAIRCLSNKTAFATIFKLAEAAEKSWRRLDGHNQLPKVILGVKFADGVEVIRSQAQAAAA